jgi:hypothetical protein
MAGLPGALQTVQEGIHHLLVADQGEDQRDVDADPLGQARRDGRQSLPGGRDLDEQVGPVHQPPQEPRLGGGGLGVVGQPRVDLDRYAPVHPAGRVVHRSQHIAGPAHVEGGHRPQRLPDDGAARPQVADLLRVRVAAGDRLGKDRRVGGHPHHVVMSDQVGQAAGHQPLAAQVIQPD